jgi:hypothetical protein
MCVLSPDERATALGLPRSFDKTPAPANYDWPAHVRRARSEAIAERDDARTAAKWLGGIAVVLTLLLLYVCSLPAPAAPVCPANVMALDPLTIRANGAPVVEI